MSDLVNPGIVSLNKEKGSDSVNKTVVVLGVARSGTSMVANILEILGVFMGKVKDNIVFEDIEMANMLENKFDRTKFIKFIKERDNAFPIWGWKRPGSIKQIDKFDGIITNPHYIIMFRDTLAITLRNAISVDSDIINNLRETHELYNETINFISKTNKPCLLISYEKALHKKHFFINSVSDFLNLTPDSSIIKEALDSIKLDKPSYLSSTKKHKITGVLDGFANGCVYGWAYAYSPDPVSIDIYINDKNYHTIYADQYRQDLEQNGIGNGHHSFEFDISDDVKNIKECTIHIKTSIENFELNESPFVIIQQ